MLQTNRCRLNLQHHLLQGMRFVGRMALADAAGPGFAWPGIGVVAAVDCPSVALKLNDSGSNQTCRAGRGELQPPLTATTGTNDYCARNRSGRFAAPRRDLSTHGAVVLGQRSLLSLTSIPVASRSRRLRRRGASRSSATPCARATIRRPQTRRVGSRRIRREPTRLIAQQPRAGYQAHTIVRSGKGVVHNYGTDTVDQAMAERSRPDS